MSGEEPIISGMARRYALAIFDLAIEAGTLEEVENDLNTLGSMLAASVDLVRLVRSPVFDRETQGRAMGAVMERAGISTLTQNFVGVVTRNRRLFALAEMIGGFRAMLARHRGEVTARVTAARALSDSQIEHIKATLKEAIGKEVQVATEVDTDLLGGLIVKVGSRMIDTSLATKLNKMKIAMKEA